MHFTQKQHHSFQRIFHYTHHYWKRLICSIASAAFFGAFAAAPSYVIQHMVDEVFIKRMEHLLIPFILIFFALFTLKGIFMYLSTYHLNWVSNKIVNTIRRDLFDRLINFPVPFFIKTTTGELISHFLNDINHIQNTLSTTIRDGIRSSCEAFFLLGIAFKQSWQLCLIIITIGPVVGFLIKKTGAFVRESSHNVHYRMGCLGALLQELFIGIREIKAYNTQQLEKNRFRTQLNSYFEAIMNCIHYESLAPALIEIVSMMAIGSVLYVATRKILQAAITPGQLVSFFSAIMLAYQPLKKLVQIHTKIHYALSAADRVFSVMDSSFCSLQERTLWLNNFTTAIEFHDVSFFYTQNKPVLENITLSIKKGESIGIIGSSGSGKSTLCDLLLGFITPTIGSITIDRIRLDKLTLKDLRKQIAYVSQQPFLFNDTVKANVTYGSSNATHKEIETACKAAHAHEFIENLSDGYKTVVGENGAHLSGGQKQRITIARALLKDPAILIFDEATSALDGITQEIIRLTIKELSKHKTIIAISHRHSFLKDMDRVFTLYDHALIPFDFSKNKEQELPI